MCALVNLNSETSIFLPTQDWLTEVTNHINQRNMVWEIVGLAGLPERFPRKLLKHLSIIRRVGRGSLKCLWLILMSFYMVRILSR